MNKLRYRNANQLSQSNKGRILKHLAITNPGNLMPEPRYLTTLLHSLHPKRDPINGRKVF